MNKFEKVIKTKFHTENFIDRVFFIASTAYNFHFLCQTPTIIEKRMKTSISVKEKETTSDEQRS